MPGWVLPALIIVMLGRVLVVPATPVPTFQLLPQNCSPTTPYPPTSEGPSATSAGPSAAWTLPNAGPRLSPRITLSLDVPIGLLKILLEQARTRAARAQAAINAGILAHVGRR